MNERTRRRLYVLCGALVIVVAIIIGQLVRLQVVEQAQWKTESQLVRSRTLTFTAPRGRIWDRRGDLLADNVTRYQVTADPGPVNVNKAVEQLAPLLSIPPNEMRAKLAGAPQQVLLATKLPMSTGDAVRKLDLWAVYATPYWQRSYPEHQLLSHVLGFVNAQGQGYYGVEGQYDSMLRGRKETVQANHDAYAQPSPFDPALMDEPRSGVDLVLTIDRTLQALTEAELARALSDTGAKSGTIIAMDPRTGAILAMASLPMYDPNDYVETPTSRFVNPAVSAPYEPGSTFKVLTMAAALQEGRVTPNTVYNDTAWIEVGGQVIRNWDRKGHGPSTMIDLLANSLKRWRGHAGNADGRTDLLSLRSGLWHWPPDGN